MKTVSVILVIFLSFSFAINKTRVKITDKSEVVIRGKSNVNSFQCRYNSNYIEDEVFISFSKNSSKTTISGAKIAIKSDGFDCGHKMITKDFKSILNANEYSYIFIDLKEFSSLEENNITAKVNVEIAGVKKEFVLPITFDSKTNNVKGVLNLNINDFKLKPPKKLLGMIKVNEQVEIDFNLYLQY